MVVIEHTAVVYRLLLQKSFSAMITYILRWPVVLLQILKSKKYMV